MSLLACNNSAAVSRRTCWWPAGVFLLLTAGAIVWVRFFWEVHAQDKNIWTYLLCGVCFFCLLLWLLVLSRLSWRTRLNVLGVVALLHGIVFATIRIQGVDGNLVPILAWRWSAQTEIASRSAAPLIAQVSPDPAGLRISGWPQFLGPTRNCQVNDIQLETNWVKHPPRELWRVPVGPGWSGFAVADGFAVTQEQEGDRETVTCFDALSGGRLWMHSYEARYSTTIAGEGPRATPTISDGLVFAVGSTGWLTCLELNSGRVLWARNPIEETGAMVPEWGFSVSPLVVSNRVILSVGGTNGHSLMAFDKSSGKPLWTGGDDRASYSSPVLVRLGGVLQVVAFNYASVAGHDLETGQSLWSVPYSPAQVHVAAPLAFGEDQLLFSSGYGHGSELYVIHRRGGQVWVADLVWKSRRMKAKFTNLVEHEGYIYGLDDGILACISAETGELQWKDGRYGHGQIILVGDLFLLLSESGELVLLEPSPEHWVELCRTAVFSGKTWNPPALAGGYLFLRTDREAVCLQLATR